MVTEEGDELALEESFNPRNPRKVLKYSELMFDMVRFLFPSEKYLGGPGKNTG